MIFQVVRILEHNLLAHQIVLPYWRIRAYNVKTDDYNDIRDKDLDKETIMYKN